jgi:ribonuclease HII
MIDAAKRYPVYGFERHKGYPTSMHRDAIAAHGPCDMHRRSFSWK